MHETCVLSQIQECVVAILDATVDQDAGVIHNEVLEVDDEGNTPDREAFKCPSQHSIELVVKNTSQFKVTQIEQACIHDGILMLYLSLLS